MPNNETAQKSFEELAKGLVPQYHFNRAHWCKMEDVLELVAKLSNAHGREVTDAVRKATAPYSDERNMRDDRIMEAMDVLDSVEGMVKKVRELMDHPSGYIADRHATSRKSVDASQEVKTEDACDSRGADIVGESAPRPMVVVSSTLFTLLDYAINCATSELENAKDDAVGVTITPKGEGSDRYWSVSVSRG